MRRNDVEGLIERLRNDVVGLHNEHPAVETMVEAAEALSRHKAAGDVVAEASKELDALFDRLTNAIDRAAEDIGGESVNSILPLLGPAFERHRTALTAWNSIVQGDGDAG